MWVWMKKETAKPEYIIAAADLSADSASKLWFAEQLGYSDGIQQGFLALTPPSIQEQSF